MNKIFIFFLFAFAMTSAASQPNIIVILTDDQRADYLGIAGHPILKTPNIDQLAKEGVYFKNAFVTTAACTPNRTCILTGQYERKHGVTFSSGSSLTEEAFAETYPMLLRKAGYYVAYVGKNHTPIGPAAEDSTVPMVFRTFINKTTLGYGSGLMEQGFDYWYGNHGHTTFYPKNPHAIYKNAKANTQIEILQEGALNLLEANPAFTGSRKFLESKPEDKPFCLLINFNVPHGAGLRSMQQRPGDPETYKSLYRDQLDDFPLPETYISSADLTEPKIPTHVYNGKTIETYDYVKNEADLRENMLKACQTVTGVDHLVGALVAELKEQGLYENTVIVFTSDHGIQFGEHGLGGKVLLYEESLRVPMILFDPRVAEQERGKVSEELVLSIDIAPTLLELAGLDPHPEMQGASLKPLLRGEGGNWREDFFCENMFTAQNYPRIEGVRSDRYKYLRYFDKKKDKHHLKLLTASINGEEAIYEELYDLAEDPKERNNLATSAAHKDILAEFRARCKTLVKEAKGNEAYPKTYIKRGAKVEKRIPAAAN